MNRPPVAAVLASLFKDDTYDPDGWGDYLHYGFEGCVQEVARVIHDLDERFYFGWEAELEGGGVVGANIGIYLGDSCYLHRWLELKRLTNDRDATGRDQASSIAFALLDAYDRVLNKQDALKEGVKE